MVSNIIGVKCHIVYNQVSNVSIICPYKYLSTNAHSSLVIAPNLATTQMSTIGWVNRETNEVYPHVGIVLSNEKELLYWQ